MTNKSKSFKFSDILGHDKLYIPFIKIINLNGENLTIESHEPTSFTDKKGQVHDGHRIQLTREIDGKLYQTFTESEIIIHFLELCDEQEAYPVAINLASEGANYRLSDPK